MKQGLSRRLISLFLSFVLLFSLAFTDALQTSNTLSAAIAPTAGAEGYVNDDYVNLRSGAGTTYEVVTCMRENTKFTFVDGKLYNSNWYKIKLANNVEGYIYSTYASVVSPTGYVNGTNVNLRSGPSTSYSVVKCMAQNTKFSLLSTELFNSEWYYVCLSDGTKGYVIKTFVTLDDAEQATPTTVTGYINGDKVNLRSGAGTSYDIVTCMAINTKFTFLSTTLYNSDWYYIQLEDGTKGYVIRTYVTKDSPSSGNSSASNSSSAVSSSNSSQAKYKTSGYINRNNTKLYSSLTAPKKVLCDMKENTKISFLTDEIFMSKWYYVRLFDGTKGYVDKKFVTVTQPASRPPSSSSGSSSSSTSSGSSSNTSSSPSSSSSSTVEDKISLSLSSVNLYKGNYWTITATASGKVVWSSSNTNVVTVSDGLIYAKGTGTATVKATCGTKSATCTVTVTSGNSVKISSSSVSTNAGRSIYLTSLTSGVSWKTSDSSIAQVSGGIVDTKKAGTVVITANTESGAASCVIKVGQADNIRFTYASPNSAPLNSTVTFKAITDSSKTSVKFVVSNGTTSYTVNANQKISDGSLFVWTGTKALPKSGVWTITAYSKTATTDFATTQDYGKGEVFVTASNDLTTTVCAERRASESVINLIANYEGFLSKVTPDSITGDPTLGYGKVVLSGEQFYNNLTKNEAYAYLCKTVNSGGYTSRTNKFLLDNGVKFNQQQFDALVCFAYNVGANVFYSDPDLQAVLLGTGNSGAQITAGSSGYVNDYDVNLRAGAGTSYGVVTRMAENTKFTFIDGVLYNSNWYKIKLSDGTVGYIYSTYASLSGTTNNRDLNDIDKQGFIKNLLQYHHAAGKCYKGLLYRRIDEAEAFLYGDYARNGEKNLYGIKFTCSINSSFTIG